jgi:siroheme synthase-like protein
VNDLPVMLKLVGRRCLVIGGGKVAARRAQGLADAGADVTVVAPQLDDAIGQIPAVTTVQRAFVDSDLDDIFLVVIATDDADLNTHINALARKQRVLVNRADDPDAGDISIPAHAHCGPVTVAVHTHRISALAAATIRDELLEHMDPAWPVLLTAMQPYRTQLQEKVPDTFLRQSVLKNMANEQAISIFKEQGVMSYHSYCESLLAQAVREISGEGGKP